MFVYRWSELILACLEIFQASRKLTNQCVFLGPRNQRQEKTKKKYLTKKIVPRSLYCSTCLLGRIEGITFLFVSFFSKDKKDQCELLSRDLKDI